MSKNDLFIIFWITFWYLLDGVVVAVYAFKGGYIQSVKDMLKWILFWMVMLFKHGK